VVVQEKLYTAADLLALPDDGKRYELVEGTLIEMATPTHAHALVSGRLFTRLSVYVEDHDLGYVTGSDGGYLLSTNPETGRDTVRIPDVAFVTKARKARNQDKIYEGVPDLAVEVISPSELFTMIRRKLHEYFTSGVRRVWLVYPDAKSIEVYQSEDNSTVLDTSGTLDGGDLLPGFSPKVEDVFAVLEK
jgi:Uma2 family endonuclease